jgi:hypothetical protein
MAPPDNPPAFPRDGAYVSQNGMDLRDWFAGQALPRVIRSVEKASSRKLDEGDDITEASMIKTIAQTCYALADAMLEERERRR